jgi:predicted naringenin-chalcone synthase
MVDFLLKLDSDLKEGEYKLKVKMIKGKQKTSTDLTETFYVLGDFPIGGDKETLKIKLSEDVPELTNVNQENDLTTFSTKKELMLDQIEGIVVYESSSEKAKKVIPYLLSLVLGLICIILVFRK